MLKCYCHPYEVFAINLFSGLPGYTEKNNNKEKWKIINIDYFVGIKKVIPKGGKSHRRMSVNQERKSQGVPEDGNEAIVNK